MNSTDTLAALALGVPLVVLLCVGVYGCKQVTTQKFCLEHGQPGSKISWTLDGYCIRRVDQTDIVTPISTIR